MSKIDKSSYTELEVMAEKGKTICCGFRAYIKRCCVRAATVGKTLLQNEDDIERVTESGMAASCCTVVLTIFSGLTILLLFPFSLLYVIKVFSKPLYLPISLSNPPLWIFSTVTLLVEMHYCYAAANCFSACTSCRWCHSMRGL